MFSGCKNPKEVIDLFEKISLYVHPECGGAEELFELLEAAKDRAIESIVAYNEYAELCDQAELPRYELTNQAVHQGDTNLNIINDILDFSSDDNEFNSEFTLSVANFFKRKKYITSAQYNALVKIYNAFVKD